MSNYVLNNRGNFYLKRLRVSKILQFLYLGFLLPHIVDVRIVHQVIQCPRASVPSRCVLDTGQSYAAMNISYPKSRTAVRLALRSLRRPVEWTPARVT